MLLFGLVDWILDAARIGASKQRQKLLHAKASLSVMIHGSIPCGTLQVKAGSLIKPTILESAAVHTIPSRSDPGTAQPLRLMAS